MTEQDLLILQNFASLWERVQNGSGVTAEAADPREAVLEKLYTLRSGYRDMARQARGRVRGQLLCMEQESTQVIRHLQAGLFLDTGDTFIPIKCRIFCKLNACDLQKIWKNATELLQLCRTGNLGRTEDVEADLAAAGALANRHRETLRGILQELL